jgi:hypothetical protein
MRIGCSLQKSMRTGCSLLNDREKDACPCKEGGLGVQSRKIARTEISVLENR